MNWTVDLQDLPLPEEKVHMLAVQPAVMRTKPWPLPQSTETDEEPGITTAIHQALVPLYHVTDRPLEGPEPVPEPESVPEVSHAHGHSHWLASTVESVALTAGRKADEQRSTLRIKERRANRALREAIVVSMVDG
jgi:hypothetical protein